LKDGYRRRVAAPVRRDSRRNIERIGSALIGDRLYGASGEDFSPLIRGQGEALRDQGVMSGATSDLKSRPQIFDREGRPHAVCAAYPEATHSRIRQVERRGGSHQVIARGESIE